MNPNINQALLEKDPFDAIWAFESCFDCDRERLELEPNEGRRMMVAAAMFASVFGASGYAGIVYELHPKLNLLRSALEALGVVNIAGELSRIQDMAQKRGLTASSDEDLWAELVADNQDFRMATQRDVPEAAVQIAEAMKQYVRNNPAFFE